MSSERRRGPMLQSRFGRGAALAKLALRIGGRYAARSPHLIFASVDRRAELRHELALRTADDVAEELGSMKGALMKLGQMASYIDEDMPESFRTAMARLQHNAPPMTPELASSVIVDGQGGRGQSAVPGHCPHHHLGRKKRSLAPKGRRRRLPGPGHALAHR